MGMPTKVSFAARWDEDTLEAIRRRAAKAGFSSVSEYVKRAALGTVAVDRSDIEVRFGELEDRLKRLEDLAFGA